MMQNRNQPPNQGRLPWIPFRFLICSVWILFTAGLGQFNEDLQVGNVNTSGSPATKIPPHDPPTTLLSQCESIPVNTAMNTAAGPFGHQRSAALLHRPCLAGLDYTTRDSNAEGFLQDFQHTVKFTLPRPGPELIREQRMNSDSFRTAARQRRDMSPFGNPTSSRQTTCMPRVDFPISFPRTNHSHEHIISHPISSMYGEAYEWVTPVRRPSQGDLPENVGQIGLNATHRDEGENQISCDFLRSIWNDGKKWSETSAYFTNPSARGARLPNSEPSQHRILFEDNFQHFQDLPPHDLETQTHLGNRMHDGRYVSEMETLDQGIVQTPGIPRTGTETFHHDVHFPRTLFRWRGICEPPQDNAWSAKPVTRRDRRDNMWDRTCRSTDDWPPFPPSKSLEEENSFNDLPRGPTLRLSQLARLSPDDWVFPRMKLY